MQRTRNGCGGGTGPQLGQSQGTMYKHEVDARGSGSASGFIE